MIVVQVNDVSKSNKKHLILRCDAWISINQSFIPFQIWGGGGGVHVVDGSNTTDTASLALSSHTASFPFPQLRAPNSAKYRGGGVGEVYNLGQFLKRSTV